MTFSKRGPLLLIVSGYILSIFRYLYVATTELRDFLHRSIKVAWVTALITIVIIVLFHVNAKILTIANAKQQSTSVAVQIILTIIFLGTAYNLPRIARFIWLLLGPHGRWFTCFAALETAALMVASYSFFSKLHREEALNISLFITVTALVAAIIGSVRQIRFDQKQSYLAQQSRLFRDRSKTEHFEINGQIGPTQRLVNLLQIEKNPNAPLIVAVDGKWGDGKTYLVEHAIKHLPVDDNNYVIVRFEPWRHASEDAIITNFYSTLGHELSKLPGSAGIRLDIAALSRSLVNTVDKTGTAQALLTQLPPASENQASLDKADKLLADTGKRLLLIIDDVERCLDRDRILRTLQLGVHIGNDIKNSTTIIISDIQEILTHKEISETFLQKVIDEKITVLPPTKQEMLNATNALMGTMDFDIKLEQDQRLDMLMRNVRGIKRVLNGLDQDYKNVGDNIHPQDLFTMNALKHAFPTIYADISQNRSYYVPFEYDDYNDEGFTLYGLMGERDDSDFIKDQTAHFQSLLKNLDLSPRDKRRLISVIENLFPATNKRFYGNTEVINNPYSTQHRRERRIGVNRLYLDRYFLLSNEVDKRHIIENSQAAVRDDYFAEKDDAKRLGKLRSIVPTDLDGGSEELFYGALADILSGLNHDSPERKVLARDMLRLYFQETGYLVRDEKRSLLIIVDAIDRYVNNNDYAYVFEHIDRFMHHPSTGLRLLLYINPTRDNSFHNLKSYPGYTKLSEKILKKIDDYYIKQANDVLDEDVSNNEEWRFTIAQWATSVCYNDHTYFVPARFKRVNRYLIAITANNPSKFRDLIMGAFWQSFMGEGYKFIFNSQPQPYDVQLLAKHARQLLKQPNLEESVTNDLKAFLKAYRVYASEQKQIDTASAKH